MTDFASSFQELVSGLSKSASQESDLILLQLEPPFAERLRICAIPHTFDADILKVLDPGMDAVEIGETLDVFASLPSVIHLHDCLAVHDVVRGELFQKWLTPENRQQFAGVSARLAEHYRPRESDSPADRAGRANAYIFHLLGSDLAQGFALFQASYEERRERARFSEAEALVRLLREYATVLDARERAWLQYYEAEVAFDSRDFERADSLLNALIAGELPSELRARSLLRRGAVLRHQRRYEAARESARVALSWTTDEPLAFRAHHELGIISRDEGNFNEARRELELARDNALARHHQFDLAVASNSLGTLLRKPLPREAIAMLQQALVLMDKNRDGVRIAQIMNNLAMAHADVGDWGTSERLYRESLEIKMAAGDGYGQALTLLNMARIHRAQQKTAEARKALMESAALFAAVRAAKYEGIAHLELARLAKGAGWASEVEGHFKKAVELLEAAGAAEELAAARTEIKPEPIKTWIIVALAIGGTLFVVVLILALIGIASGL